MKIGDDARTGGGNDDPAGYRLRDGARAERVEWRRQPIADCRLPFKDECMDLVACNPVHEHVRHAPSLMREVARVPRPGGAALPTHVRVLRK